MVTADLVRADEVDDLDVVLDLFLAGVNARAGTSGGTCRGHVRATRAAECGWRVEGCPLYSFRKKKKRGRKHTGLVRKACVEQLKVGVPRAVHSRRVLLPSLEHLVGIAARAATEEGLGRERCALGGESCFVRSLKKEGKREGRVCVPRFPSRDDDDDNDSGDSERAVGRGALRRACRRANILRT